MSKKGDSEYDRYGIWCLWFTILFLIILFFISLCGCSHRTAEDLLDEDRLYPAVVDVVVDDGSGLIQVVASAILSEEKEAQVVAFHLSQKEDDMEAGDAVIIVRKEDKRVYVKYILKKKEADAKLEV